MCWVELSKIDERQSPTKVNVLEINRHDKEMKSVAKKLFFGSDFRGRMRLIQLMLLPFRIAKSAYGPVMTVDAKDYTNLASLFGAYGTELSDLIRNAPKDAVFIDIGANLGIYSLIAAEHLSDGHVISFEPNPFIFKRLLDNLELNSARNVLAINSAVGSPAGLLELVFIRSHSGASHLDQGLASEHATRAVLCSDLSEFQFLFEILKGREVICKIDVEGAEARVLQALVSSGVLPLINKIYIEICGSHLERFGTTPQALYAKLAQYGFQATKITKPEIMQDSFDELFCRRF